MNNCFIYYSYHTDSGIPYHNRAYLTGNVEEDTLKKLNEIIGKSLKTIHIQLNID